MKYRTNVDLLTTGMKNMSALRNNYIIRNYKINI